MNRIPSLMIAGCVGMNALNSHGVNSHSRAPSPRRMPNIRSVPVHTTLLALFRRSPPSACPTIVEMESDRPSMAMKLMLMKRSPIPYADRAIVALDARPMMPVRTRNPNDVPEAPIEAGRPILRMRLYQNQSGRRSRQVTRSPCLPLNRMTSEMTAAIA